MQKLTKRLLITLAILMVLLGGSWWGWRVWWSWDMLNAAILEEDIETVGSLLQLGAKIDDPELSAESEFGTPLRLAILYENKELAKMLLEHGANPNELGMYESSPLSVAIVSKNVGMVQLLLLHGAEPIGNPLRSLGVNGAFPDRDEIARSLLRNGADPMSPKERASFARRWPELEGIVTEIEAELANGSGSSD